MNAVRPGLRLTIAVGHTPRMSAGIDVPAVDALVDQVGLMTYDFIGPWSERTGLLAPLSASEDFRGGTVERSITSWHQAGVPLSKLLMGVPFYAYGWKQVPEEANGLFQEGQGFEETDPTDTFRASSKTQPSTGIRSRKRPGCSTATLSGPTTIPPRSPIKPAMRAT